MLHEHAAFDVEIPKRALFKSSEVCEIASVQPYVLRSWESEFPDLGVARSEGGARIYRRVDVERVLRIKQLVFADGLTLAGVRRRLESDAAPVLNEAEEAPLRELLGRNAGERLSAVKEGLQAILKLLSDRPGESAILKARTVHPAPPHRQAPTASRVGAPAKRKNGARSAKPAGKASRKRHRGR